MTVNIPQKAGFVATPDEWDALVRIAENLAAQVVQRDAALRGMQAERDAARAEVARLRAAINKVVTALKLGKSYEEFEAAYDELKATLRGQPAPAQYPLDDEPCDNCVHGKKWHWDGGKCQNACPCEQYKPAPAQGQNYYTGYNVPACSECNGTWRVETDEFGRIICPMCKDEPAPAQPLDDDGVCKCGHSRGQHRGVCMIFPCKCMEFTAPAQGQE